MDLQTIAVDKELQKKGVWIKVEDDCAFLIASTDSQPYIAAMRKLYKENKRKIDGGFIPEDFLKKELLNIEAKYIWLGWKNLSDYGVELEYSPGEAARILSVDKRTRDFVMGSASDQENYKKEEVKKLLKNSKTTSTGDTNTEKN